MLVRLVLAVCLGLWGSACIDREPFACDAHEQCESPGRPGQCVEPGYCAHQDGSCPSGWRFGRFASTELAGRCTEPEGSASWSSGGADSGDVSSSSVGTADASASSSDGGGSSSSGEPVPVEECDGIDNDGDGLIDEWSERNQHCNGCELYQRNGSAYWRCSTGRWTDLQPRCESFGANLASVQDSDENLFLALRTESGANWIGLNDIGNEGVYTWVDGEPLEYTNWTSGVPPSDDLTANCGGITTQGEWSIFNCTNSRLGFCEAPHPD